MKDANAGLQDECQWQTIGEAFFHGEAGYLTTELKKRDIPSRFFIDQSRGTPQEAIYSVKVKKQDYETSLLMRNELLGEEAGTRVRRNGFPWKRSASAGALGLLVGLRVGTKLKSPIWTAALALGFMALSFACVAFWPKRNPKGQRQI